MLNQSSDKHYSRYLIDIIYFFNHFDVKSRKSLLESIRPKTNNDVFSLICLVFISYETEITEANQVFVDQCFYFAQQGIISNLVGERNNSIDMFYHLMNLDHERVISLIQSKIPQLSQAKHDETKKAVIRLFSSLIRCIIASPSYNTLSKQF